ncbi:MAG: hypothetical protein NXI20_01760 [bacterium]|nr:hypothetical protein [bacterium]
MKKKSKYELEQIIQNKSNFQGEAVEAAEFELKFRDQNGIEEEVPDIPVPSGEDKYQDYIQSIKKNSKVRLTSKFQSSFHTSIPKESIYIIIEKAFEELEWVLVYTSETQVEAKRKNNFSNFKEKITVEIDNSNVTVKSKSIDGALIDSGRNYIAVRLLTKVFNDLAASLSEEELQELTTKRERQNNWDDYEIPEKLTPPPKYKEPNIILPIIFAGFGVLSLAGLFALVSKFIYVIILFEVLIGLGLSFVVGEGIKHGNYTNGLGLKVIFIFSIISIVVLNQYFQYLLVLNEISRFDLNFVEFMSHRLQQGFYLKEINTGIIGWVVIFILQLLIIGGTAFVHMFGTLTHFAIKRIPDDVLTFAFYLIAKNKSVDQIRSELNSKGWTDSRAQDYVMEALAAIKEQSDYARG